MDAKTIRKQLRNVIEEHLTEEALKAVMEKVLGELTIKTDAIEKMCNDRLTKVDERSKNVHGFHIRNAMDLQSRQELFEDRQDAMFEILAEEGVKIDNLFEKVEARAAQVATRKKEVKAEQYRQKMEAAAARAKAAQDANAEQPAPQGETPSESPAEQPQA